MLSRRKFMAGCSTAVLLRVLPAKAWIHGNSTGSVHMNITGASSGPTFCPFLNYYKAAPAGNLIIHRSAGGDLQGTAIWTAGGYLDPATGDLINPVPADVIDFNIIWYSSAINTPVTDDTGIVWNIAWDGRGGTVSMELLTTGGTQSINSAAGTGTFTFGTAPGNTRLRCVITNVNDPPHNFRIWQNRYNTNWLNGEIFNPDFIALAKKFYRLRMVDWMGSNVTNANMSTFTVSTQFSPETWFNWSTQGVDGSSGPKGTVPLSVIAKLANATGCKLHVNIPYLATDQCVTDIATFFKVNTNLEVAYEYSNEAWNPGYPVNAYGTSQAALVPGNPWSGDSNATKSNKWYGYRSAQCMKIIRDVYNDTTRWSGVLATQTVSTTVTNNALTGIAYWKSNTGSALNVSDLFSGLYVTGYFGDQQNAKEPSTLTLNNPGVVTLNSHGYSNGQVLRFFCNTGTTQLNNVDVTIANVTANTFSIGVDTTGFSAWAANQGSYVIPAVIFDIMDQSLTNFINDPVTWPTKYTYFNQQLSASLLTGTCSAGFTTGVNVANLQATHWPAQKTIATANGLELNQYESGSQFVGNPNLQGGPNDPTNAQFTEYLLASGHSSEIAAVYAAGFSGFVAIGGKHPSKYNMAGVSTIFGTWPGMQSIPETPTNPVWQAVLNANGVG